MKNFLKTLVGGVAPTIASALGGPLAGTAINALAEALGLDQNQDHPIEEAIAAKLETATAEDWRKIKESENQFKVEMRKLDISEEQIHQMDRESARERQVKTQDKIPDILAFLVVIIFGSVLGFVLWMALNEVVMNEQLVTVINILLGILAAGMTSVLNYYFGSSKGSRAKDSLMKIK